MLRQDSSNHVLVDIHTRDKINQQQQQTFDCGPE